MKLPPSVRTALLIVAATAAYFGARSAMRAFSVEEKTPIEDRTLAVVAVELASQPRARVLTIRGRTQADQKVVVRADASGVVAETPMPLGAAVKKGDVLCRLEVEARDAASREATAALRKAEIDYQAAVRLAAEGFRSEAGLAGLKAARDQAQANADRAAIELGKTNIRAPFDGVFDSQAAKVGDLLKPGDPCGAVIKAEPFLIVGAVAEKDVSLVQAGDLASARLATGEAVEGHVRFVGDGADQAKHTFSIEIEVPNKDGKLRDGVTADITVRGEARDALKAPRSALTLDDDGRIGVRVIDHENRARFQPVSIIGEDQDGVWIAGLSGPHRVIIRGQSYVKDGEVVVAGDGKGGAS
jgi:membrane fusion protein, multidrug efflux system